MNKEILEDASRKLGISKQSIRLWLRSGHCPFGDAWIGSGKSYIYFINQQKLDDYVQVKQKNRACA